MKTMRRTQTLMALVAGAMTVLPPCLASAGQASKKLSPIVEWSNVRQDPAVWKILDILGESNKWVRNNKMVDGRYVEAKCTATLVKRGPGFYLREDGAASIRSPLLDAKALYFWRRSEVEESWGSSTPTSAKQVGDVVVNEGENQWRFPLLAMPSRQWLDIRIVTRGKDTLLYVMAPGTEKYLEEWILR